MNDKFYQQATMIASLIDSSCSRMESSSRWYWKKHDEPCWVSSVWLYHAHWNLFSSFPDLKKLGRLQHLYSMLLSSSFFPASLGSSATPYKSGNRDQLVRKPFLLKIFKSCQPEMGGGEATAGQQWLLTQSIYNLQKLKIDVFQKRINTKSYLN